MSRPRFSRRAYSDLLEIAKDTLERWGQEQAILYIGALEHCCRLLAQNPALGRSCDDIRPGLRRMEHGRHVIFYRHKDGETLVSRILHQRMLPQGHDI